MKKKLIPIIFIFLSIFSFAQDVISISGYVVDEETGEALIGAAVVDEVSKRGTVCNEFGFFSLSIEQDSLLLQVSFIGYQTKKITIRETQKSVKIYLQPGIALNTVDVTASENIVECAEMSTIEIPIKDIESLPSFFGEADVIKAIQLTPGVQSGGESSNGMYVRGGSPDQNLVLLDDVPLYYVSHLAGFFSVFNADAIKNVKMSKGGFSARYGGRLSSVVDVRMKDGNMQKKEISGNIGLLAVKGAVQAPIIKDKLSCMVSIRKNIDPAYIFITQLPYSFYDVNIKANYTPSDSDRFYISSYIGHDKLSIKDKSGSTEHKKTVGWGNRMFSAGWNHICSPKLFSNVVVYNTKFGYAEKVNLDYKRGDVKRSSRSRLVSSINDVALKGDFSYHFKPKLHFRFGGITVMHYFKPNSEEYYQNGSDILFIDESYESDLVGYENAVYSEAELKHSWVKASLGIRVCNYTIGSDNFMYAEPRFLINVIPLHNFSIKYSYAKMNQFVHLLAHSTTGLSSDYWMPSTANAKPESSVQHSVGIFTSLFKKRVELSLETYTKSLSGLVAFKPGETLSNTLGDWESLVETGGEGSSRGVELMLQKKKGKTTGWISGTVSEATRQFENINEGKEYPFKYDRLLDIDIVANHKFNKKINVSASWSFGTSYPITLADEHYISYEELQGYDPAFSALDVLVYSKKNSYRLRDYHRLDVAIHFSKEKKWGTRKWSFGVFNLYNRQNPLYYYYDRESDEVVEYGENGSWRSEYVYGDIKLKQKSLLTVVPSISYSFTVK